MILLDLYLTRHGQSYGQLPGHSSPMQTGRMENDWCLTPLGQQQAEALGDHLAGTPFDAIYCSPLERARATAQAIAARQPKPVELQIIHDLLELDDYGPETPEEVHQRALRVARKLRGDAPPGTRVLVVAHAAFNNRLLTALLGLPAPAEIMRFGQDNTGLSRIIFASGYAPDCKNVRLYCMNDLSHLSPELYAQTTAHNFRTLYGRPS